MAESFGSRRLQYLDADDIDDDRIDFSGLDVRNAAGEKLGDVDGFIVDRTVSRPYYVVVDAGGWFSSQRLLLPIGHVRLDTANACLRTDVDKDKLKGYPTFDHDRFEELDEDQARRFNEQILGACCPNELAQRQGEARWDYDSWSHYRQPDWWQNQWIASRSLADAPYATGVISDPDAVIDDPDLTPTSTERYAEREHIMARDRDETIPLDRAQPGDVLGLEHPGKTTELGDTASDEHERLKDRREDVADVRHDVADDRRDTTVRSREEERILRDREDAIRDRDGRLRRGE